jgi:hypothetical protein
VAEASCFRVGLEAIIPVNRESGTGIGVLDQLASLSRRNFPEEVRGPLLGGGRGRFGAGSYFSHPE